MKKMEIEQALSKVRLEWKQCRPFFTRFAPELLYEQVRASILEELREETNKKSREEYVFDTYFTYPTDEQMATAHQEFSDSGLFFSEIRELVGYRAAEAISTLATLLSFEPMGVTYSFIKECLDKLWADFSSHSYSRGYRTRIVRSNLILTLATSNALRYFPGSPWLQNMKEYFTHENNEWTGEPLNQEYDYILRILQNTPSNSLSKNPIMRGYLSLSEITEPSEVDSFLNTLHWEQGEPEEDLYLPPMMTHGERRGPSQPPSDFFLIPFHLVSFDTSGMLDHWHWGEENYSLSDLTAKTLISLELRTALAKQFSKSREFTVDKASDRLNLSFWETQLILGQMIRVGLIEFDRLSGLPWNHEEQTYLCTEGVEFLCV